SATYDCMADSTYYDANATIEVRVLDPDSSSWCDEEESDHVIWPRTAANTMAYVICPTKNCSKLARRYCDFLGKPSKPKWKQSDFSDCVEYEIQSLSIEASFHYFSF